MKLYEFTAMLTVSTVIAAESKEAAKAEFESLSDEWWVDENGNSDVICVSDTDLLDVRDPRPFDANLDESIDDWLDDEAHLIVRPKQ